MTDKRAHYRLGLDMGTNSIGWAAIRLDADGNPIGVLDMGVRIFPDGREDRSETSNAAARRLARGQRRRRDRYLKRRDDLMEKLVEFGLMPEDKAERASLAKCNPYKLRARALDEPLDPFQLGRALFHLNQRRGFKSNRKAGGDENEESQTRERIAELRTDIRDAGARTLGKYLAWRHSDGDAVRARDELNLYPDRAMYEAEFDAIREAQEPRHSLSGQQWDDLRETIFFQRPLKPVEPGWCRFEENEKRAPRALPAFQEFRMLQEVNNLRLLSGTDPERPLNDDERERFLERLRSGSDIDLNKPVKILRLPPDAQFNLARGATAKIKGDEIAAKLAGRARKATQKRPAMPALFGKRWFALSPAERDEIARFLIETEDPNVARDKAVAEWDFDESQAEAVSRVSLPSGYGSLSEKAIRKLLPHLERGLVLSDAAKAAGYHHSDFRSSEAHDSLPYYGQILQRDVVDANPKKDPEKDGEPARYGRIPNPTVHIGLGQLRRVVNGLIQVYGKPEEIVVELARDLKMNREQKLQNNQRQREGRDANRRFTEMLEAEEIEVYRGRAPQVAALGGTGAAPSPGMPVHRRPAILRDGHVRPNRG